MIEICDEQMKVFMTTIYKLDNKLTEMQNNINVVKDEVKLTRFTSIKQGISGLGIAGMTSGMALSVANPTYTGTSLLLFCLGLVIYILSLFWKPKRN